MVSSSIRLPNLGIYDPVTRAQLPSYNVFNTGSRSRLPTSFVFDQSVKTLTNHD